MDRKEIDLVRKILIEYLLVSGIPLKDLAHILDIQENRLNHFISRNHVLNDYRYNQIVNYLKEQYVDVEKNTLETFGNTTTSV